MSFFIFVPFGPAQTGLGGDPSNVRAKKKAADTHRRKEKAVGRAALLRSFAQDIGRIPTVGDVACRCPDKGTGEQMSHPKLTAIR
ncbi:hypothetical protein [Ruegeria arenilitoris]|uniref:hypothetical protein n=1 Tax=Ruegeria arenilitoris TaxID=1173585 RepID=UPI00147E5E06|nr:hypothetical protein [Ruegeria arenilitoris]